MKYVAFLRAINVGGGHVVKMDALRRLFEKIGFANVETFIASGNVIFDARKVSAAKIEKELFDALGYQVRVFLRTPADLARIGEANDAGGTLYVGFLAKSVDADAKRKLEALSTADDVVRADGQELYWLCRRTFSESKFSGALLEKTLGQPLTLRNINTVRKIASKYA
jgi:uncharacterized protein (DUF1697 family)